MVFKFNINYWPIVHFSLTEEVNDENFEEYKVNFLNLLLNCKKKKQKILLICDLNANIQISMKYVLKLAAFNKKIFNFNKLYLNGVYVISKNKTFKNFFKIYLSLITPCAPYKLCSSYNKINIHMKDDFNLLFDTNIFINDNNNDSNNNNSNNNDSNKETIQSVNDNDKIFTNDLNVSKDNLNKNNNHINLTDNKSITNKIIKKDLYNQLNKEDNDNIIEKNKELI